MIAAPHSDLIIGHQTHAGETGKNNEDRALIAAYQGLPGEAGGLTLAVIADGIGGHRAGEVASQIVVNTFKALFDETDSRAYLDLFTRGFVSAQQALIHHIAANPESEGMGTTCSAVVIANRRLYIAFIGDSRIYLLRDGAIRQISMDHTWVQEAIEHGILTKQDARKHPNRHVVRRHLGAGQDPAPDFRLQLDDGEKAEDSRRNQGLPLRPGDIVLISSDGLTDLVEDHEILVTFESKTPQQAVDSLVLMARQRGGFDNITVTALLAPPGDPAGGGPRSNSRRLAPALVGGTMLVGLLLGLAALALLAAGIAMLVLNNPFRAGPTAMPTIAAASPTPPPTPTPQQAILLPDTPTVLPPTLTRTPRPTLPPTLTRTSRPTLTPSRTPTAAVQPTKTSKP